MKTAKKVGATHLEGCDLYVTLEPGPMCAKAITFARLRRVYFGAFDSKGGGDVSDTVPLNWPIRRLP